MTAPNRHLPGQFVEITRRTSQGTFFLRPGKDSRELTGYFYAKAMNDHGQIPCVATCMSNHIHSVQTDSTGNRSEFKRQFMSNMTRKRNLQIGRQENMWSSDRGGDTVILTMEAIIRKVLYVIMQPVAANCVERVEDWTGFSFLPKHWGKLIRFHRPILCGDDMPEYVEFTPMPPPGFEHIPLPIVIAFFEHLIAKAEAFFAKKRQGRVMGIARCEAISPFYVPNKPLPARKLNPRFTARDKSIIDAALLEQRSFRHEHRFKSKEFCNGHRDVVFPAGTVQMARIAGVRCREVDPDDPHLTRTEWTPDVHQQWDEWRQAA